MSKKGRVKMPSPPADFKKTVTLYTDGACSGNPGPGGWGLILKYGDHEKSLCGYEPRTTNNRMELLAVIKGLQALKYPVRVEIFSDSTYVCDAFNKGWIHGWKANGWRGSGNKAVKNRDLWETLASLTMIHECKFNWVKGHAENEYNNCCDALARSAIHARKIYE